MFWLFVPYGRMFETQVVSNLCVYFENQVSQRIHVLLFF